MLTGPRSRLERWVLVDVVLAVAALATELPEYWSQGLVVSTGEVVVAAAIATRRLLPFPAAVAYGVAWTVQALVSSDPPEDQLSLIAGAGLAYVMGTRAGWVRSLLGFGLVAAGGCAHEIWAGGDYLFVVGIALVGYLPGVAVRYRSQELAGLRAQAEALQREQAWREEASATAERNRLARDLHDVVSHSVSAMVVQAAAAEQVLTTDAVAATQALDRVQQTGRDAIVELHRLLGVLDPAERGTATVPAPNLGSIPALVQESRAAGQDVRLTMPNGSVEVPPAVQLSVYRIVQESLTNARKYAPQSEVRVCVTVRDDELEVEVVNTGGATVTAIGGGRGLKGLAERAAAFGGTFHAGPTSSGFAVHVRLPVPRVP